MPAVQRHDFLRLGRRQLANRPDSLGQGSHLPAAVDIWQRMMDHYYPQSAWLRLDRDVLDRLADYKRRHSIPTWERTIERLLAVETAEDLPKVAVR